MTDVFISYKREDRPKARAIAQTLAEKGLDVWWDVELLAGQSFAEEINAVINKAKTVIVLWTPESIDSHWVLSEASLALEKEILIPVWLQHVALPVPFNMLHTLDLSEWDGSSADHVLEDLVKAVNHFTELPRINEAIQSTREIEETLLKPAHELEFWSAVSSKKQPSIREYRLYLARFGDNGSFSELARHRIDEITKNSKKRTWPKIGPSLTLIGIVVGAVLGLLQIKEIVFPKPENLNDVNGPLTSSRQDTENKIRTTTPPNPTQVTKRDATRSDQDASIDEDQETDVDIRNLNDSSDESSAFGISESDWVMGIPGDVGSVFRDFIDSPQMVVIPAGKFVMGSPPGENGRSSNEGPQHEVEILQNFGLSSSEVTRGEWRYFVDETGYVTEDNCRIRKYQSQDYNDTGSWKNPGFGQDAGHPVVCISLEDAKTYVDWLNSRLGDNVYRLPSESEWEYAARAQTVTARYWGEDKASSKQCNHANGADVTYARFYNPGSSNKASKCEDEFAETSPVGYFGANGFGLSDMIGNAAEWTEDCSHRDYNNAPADGTAWLSGGSGSCQTRVIRGASWDWKPDLLRSAYRFFVPSNFRSSSVGFRLARALVED